ncbi:MAG: glycosyl hydrolase-related protein [Planctomycetaceae bacterium]|nr:glycosyl hydrolase-related protein [Planctomycetaceae bacterium]
MCARSVVVVAALFSSCLPAISEAADTVRILSLEPTPLFPRAKAGEPLRQRVRIKVENSGDAIGARVRITLAGQPPYFEDLGQLERKESVRQICIPDIVQPTDVRVEVYGRDTAGRETKLGGKTFAWEPQKKWKLYCIAYSHHDLGFGDYPHRLRTTIRHANITRPLRFCRETDAWDPDSKFRFVIETSEPLTSFVSSQPTEVAEELARRIREGRIQLGGLHNTANTEQLSPELMARLFYLSNRHARDLLGIPKCRTAQIDDVIGLTWPLATFCAEAEVPYFFHGPNLTGHCFGAAANEPVFYWQGPSAGSRVLVRSAFYGGYAGDNPGDVSEARVQSIIEKLGAGCPYDSLFVQEGTDFQLVTMETAKRIHAWNARFAYPRLLCATMDMFFDEIAQQAKPGQIKSFAGDGNNQWAEQDASDAAMFALARRLDELVPTVEKFATIAQVVSGGGNSWTDVCQAYHRLLAWHEHTNAIDHLGPELERMRRYETELKENREMLNDCVTFSSKARASAFARLKTAITRSAAHSLIVFNPLTRQRTDIVRIKAAAMRPGDQIVDSATGAVIPWQALPDGRAVFVAQGVPSLGYKTFEVRRGEARREASVAMAPATLENRFFRVQFDPATGAITSIHDKRRNAELVDQTAPYRFNEYLYERFAKGGKETSWHRVRDATLRAMSGPVAQVMQVNARPDGVASLRQTVILYANLPRIDFAMDMVKSPSGRRDAMPSSDPSGREALYVALPLAISNPHICHELPGCVSDPLKDLFDGANTAFYAVRHFSDVSDASGGVTISAIDSALFQYDRPRATPVGMNGVGEESFEKAKTPIATGRVYLYLMNNMFDCNIRCDQAGLAHFSYSLQSHAGDWRHGNADEFGWDTMNPLVAVSADGENRGTLPEVYSFAAVDQPNVACTTLKPAEANGAGFILRFVETQGRQTTATVSLPLLMPLVSATAVNLVEDDRAESLPIEEGRRVIFKLPPYGVKTIRVVHKSSTPSAVVGSSAKPVSDMEIALSWNPAGPADAISHYHIYRGTKPGFAPGLLNLVQRPVDASCVDRPQLSCGWITNRLEPATTYYYRVAAVNRWNREGPPSPTVAVTTMKSSDKNMRPLPVQGLAAVQVSPISRFNVVNLLWRTNCESDIRRYEVHRSTVATFRPSDATRIAVIDADAVLKGGRDYGQTPMDYRLGVFDHQMYLDESVKPGTTYYYRVRAVDAAGELGDFSHEARVSTKPS